jgi:hypothetical protein
MNEVMIKDSGVLARAELDIQITTAKAYPRNERNFVDKAISMVTISRETAESCIYCLKRGNTEIKGASVRLAEIVASSWGNMHAATRIIENDGKFITAQAVAWDMENNVKISTEVKRSITNKEGRTFTQDMQVVTGNAAASIALRNAILKVIPKSLVDMVYDAAVKHAIGDQKTFNSRRQEIFNRFNKMGIDNQKIFDFYNKKTIEEFGEEDIVSLIGIGTSIKEGTLKIDKAFSNEQYEEVNTEEKLKDILKNNKKEDDDLPY